LTGGSKSPVPLLKRTDEIAYHARNIVYVPPHMQGESTNNQSLSPGDDLVCPISWFPTIQSPQDGFRYPIRRDEIPFLPIRRILGGADSMGLGCLYVLPLLYYRADI
jgi:hypothetical protein